MTIVARFEIHYSRFLDAEGKAVGALPAFARDPGELVAMYRGMVLTRRFDAKAVALQRTGRLGTFAVSLGQEAAVIGLAAAMREGDVLVPSYRESGAMLWRGVTLEELLLYWGGDERGSDFAGPRDDFPVAVPVGTQALHAVGAAYAFKLRGEARAVVAVFGDGATSKGDVYEALNFAGVWQAPVVFVAVNNQWAISTFQGFAGGERRPFAARGLGLGIPGIRVDGNDLLAIYSTTLWAAARARRGGGPTLIELVTYRGGAHSTSDDPTKYRPKDEWASFPLGDPIERLKQHLIALGHWSEDQHEKLEEELKVEVLAAWKEAQQYGTMTEEPFLDPATMFDDVFAETPSDLESQRRYMLEIEGS
ncbi:MAG: pyruvate dehydrogenase (acetyl-transferring) E1 component subunit alpha [Proteobacteria bacterium]|nr:pyruvate dehydrogenase (acetyl-transferring) E1 component subunit alpha [Pseudomonadota bacterium]